jgi:hypothetical protein
MAIPPMTPAAIAPAPATLVLEAPLGAEVAEATALEAAEATLLTLLEAPDAAEEAADRTLETELEADEATPPDELAAEEVVDADADPEEAVWDGRSLTVNAARCTSEKREERRTYEAVEEESPVVVMAPVATDEAEAFKQSSELPAWTTVGLEYWTLPVESVILTISTIVHSCPIGGTNRKVMLDPAARLGVQVKAGPWISLPIKAIAAAVDQHPLCTHQKSVLTANLSTWDDIAIDQQVFRRVKAEWRNAKTIDLTAHVCHDEVGEGIGLTQCKGQFHR